MVIIAAGVVALAFPPFSLWLSAFIGYFLFIRALRKSRRPLFDSFAFGLVLHLVVLSWAKSYVGVPPYLSLALLQSLFALPLGVAAKYRVDLRWYPLIILLSEFARSHIPFGGFGWSNPGFTQVNSPLSPLASLGGVYLLAIIVVAAVSVRNRYQAMVIAITILAIPFVSPGIERGEGPLLSAAAIQGGYVARSTSYYEDIRKVFQRHFTLTKESKAVDLIIWPENVVDGSPDDAEFRRYFGALQGRSLIVGATPIISGAPENQAVFIDESGAIRERYTKNALVPFGEYIPFRSLVSQLNSHVDEVQDFRAGSSTTTFSLDGIRLAPIICFEIVDDAVVRRAAHLSSLLILQSNSATFVGTSQSEQQFAIARMRAIEYGRPLISAATTGVTGYIDSRGRIINRLPQNVPDALYVEIASQSGKTIYSQFPFFSLLFALFFAALGRREGRDEANHSYPHV